MSERLGEVSQFFSELINVSSAASGLTNAYSMEDCDKITFICALGTVAAAATAISPVFTAVQSADLGLSTNAAITGCTAICGPTTANQVSDSRSVLVTFTTASTGAQTVTVNGSVFTFSTLGTSTVSTALTFGSTEGSTVAEGLRKASSSLAAAINNSTVGFFALASTASTAAVRITAKDTASTGLAVATTDAGAYAVTSEKMHSVIEIKAEDLNSTSKYVGISISTAATSVPTCVTVIKHGLRNSRPYRSAQVHRIST